MTSKQIAESHEEDAASLRLAIVRLSRHLRALDATSALTPTQASLLSTVVRRGPLGLSELSEIEGIDAPTLSRAVGLLERQGFVERRRDPDDRRAVTAKATAAGKRLYESSRASHTDALRARLAELDADDRRRLHAALPVLETLGDALKARRTGRA